MYVFVCSGGKGKEGPRVLEFMLYWFLMLFQVVGYLCSSPSFVDKWTV
jgi:hypothetical protein